MTDQPPHSKYATQMLDALRHLQEVNPTMTVGQAIAFFTASIMEGASAGEIATAARTSSVSMSRYLMDLSIKQRSGKPGYGLIDRNTDPVDLRRNSYSLTHRGQMLMNAVADALKR